MRCCLCFAFIVGLLDIIKKVCSKRKKDICFTTVVADQFGYWLRAGGRSTGERGSKGREVTQAGGDKSTEGGGG